MQVLKNSLAGQHLLILGLGETGSASARWCLSQGAKVRLADTRAQPAGFKALGGAAVTTQFGETALFDSTLDDIDAVVLSPGLSPNAPEVARFLEQARSRGIEIIGEVELFARALVALREQCQYEPQVVAITGTNGKTTVTLMVQAMLRAAGLDAVAAGNISPSVLDALMQALAQQTLPQVWVLELSSFQLGTTQSLCPNASTVLNISQDHLDWHKDADDYAAHKAKLLHLSSYQVIADDDPVVRQMMADREASTVISFGSSAPTRAGDFGLYEEGGVKYLAYAQGDELRQPMTSYTVRTLMPVAALPVTGTHNALNALAALALCRCLGVDWPPLLAALRTFESAPHRMSFVRTVAGVDFINDSKGTNVGATLAAIQGLAQPMVLIMGGLAKGQDFHPLAQAIKQYVQTIILIGQDALVIQEALADTGVLMLSAMDMMQAVRLAIANAQDARVVLLSPACASMDMFDNYMARGQAFEVAVHEVALDYGEV